MTSTVPGTQTRCRSLRTRSVIMTFSARSLSVIASGVAAVPLIGPLVTTPPSTRRYSSGDAVTTHTSPGTCTPPGVRRRVARAQQRTEGARVGLARAAERSAPGRDSPGRRRLPGCAPAPGRPRRRSRHGRARTTTTPPTGRSTPPVTTTCAGATCANRHARTVPSKSPTTAHQPGSASRSGCARTSTTSTTPVASTPANHATPRRLTVCSGTPTRYRAAHRHLRCPRDPRDHPGARSQLDSRGDRQLEFGTHTEHR